MKKLALTIILMTVLTFLTSSAFAQEGEAYFGINYEMWKYDADIANFNVGVLGGKFGYKINNNFAIEGKLGLGIADDSTTESIPYWGDIEATLKPGINLGLFGVGVLPANENFELYAKAGFNIITYKIEIDSLDYSDNGTEAKLAIGFGSNILFDKQQGLNIEILFPHTDIFTFGFGYVRKF